MRTITYEAAEKQEDSVSAFLMLFLEYATEIGVFGLLERLVKVKMKVVVYSALNKAQTIMASLVMGCPPQSHQRSVGRGAGSSQLSDDGTLSRPIAD